MIENCKITKTQLGIEDHGMMIFFITVEGCGWGVSIGGYSLDKYIKDQPREGCGKAYQAIRRILEILEIDTWEKLPGTIIRVETEGPGSQATKIGHIIKDKWFDIKEYMKST